MVGDLGDSTRFVAKRAYLGHFVNNIVDLVPQNGGFDVQGGAGVVGERLPISTGSSVTDSEDNRKSNGRKGVDFIQFGFLLDKDIHEMALGGAKKG